MPARSLWENFQDRGIWYLQQWKYSSSFQMLEHMSHEIYQTTRSTLQMNDPPLIWRELSEVGQSCGTQQTNVPSPKIIFADDKRSRVHNSGSTKTTVIDYEKETAAFSLLVQLSELNVIRCCRKFRLMTAPLSVHVIPRFVRVGILQQPWSAF